MNSTTRAKARLLAIVVPSAVVACGSATSGPSPSSSSTKPQASSTGTILVRGSSFPLPPYHEPIKVPSPPFQVPTPVSIVSASALPSGSASPLAYCGRDAYSWSMASSGGPYAQVYCYQPAEPKEACFAVDDIQLRKALTLSSRQSARCVYDGPSRQPVPNSSNEACCYSLSFMGMGRPLVIGQMVHLAPLGPNSLWA